MVRRRSKEVIFDIFAIFEITGTIFICLVAADSMLVKKKYSIFVLVSSR